ncbi:16S rRNA (guanine(527)-N(7))-methyltransferase RsmG [Iocasia frigidifontis]|uniref:Ribosomal RNA small subunit methyltransferase G n=1 Tax=Iocasia fonsfrigidae TaxID=2682810 RepID=A0A8A7KDJ8_9FIRM|nr:16S rRNA (guanine(527)-N(7))-methyltransferase RsmG [Iocasia fonsfrigidae]QTL99866.1 16S rRNA (guanine(527)-N(7))-methyltransferase RsmG [Iocasia fonsfrigidae]
MKKSIFKEKMTKGITDMGLEFTNIPVDRLWVYTNLLISENKKYNLTAIVDYEEIINKHFLDSLGFFQLGSFRNEDYVIDVGTGPGFPGMVIKIFFPQISLVLLDANKKKVRFLQLLIEHLQVDNVEVIHGRAEDLADKSSYRERFDFVFSRAVAPLNILAEYTLPFARVKGQVQLYKGPDCQQEIEEGAGAVMTLGGIINNVKKIKIPSLTGERYIINIEKRKKTPVKYPRRAGIPKKRPL